MRPPQKLCRLAEKGASGAYAEEARIGLRDGFGRSSLASKEKTQGRNAARRALLAFDHAEFASSPMRLFGRLEECDRILAAEGADQVEIDRLRASEVPIEIVPLDAAFAVAAGEISQ